MFQQAQALDNGRLLHFKGDLSLTGIQLGETSKCHAHHKVHIVTSEWLIHKIDGEMVQAPAKVTIKVMLNPFRQWHLYAVPMRFPTNIYHLMEINIHSPGTTYQNLQPHRQDYKTSDSGTTLASECKTQHGNYSPSHVLDSVQFIVKWNHMWFESCRKGQLHHQNKHSRLKWDLNSRPRLVFNRLNTLLTDCWFSVPFELLHISPTRDRNSFCQLPPTEPQPSAHNWDVVPFASLLQTQKPFK